MRMAVPTGARLQNIEAFAKRVFEPDDPELEVHLPTTYFAVHPMVLAAIASAGLRARAAGARLDFGEVPITRPVRYLHRMGLFDLLGVDVSVELHERESAGRFIPLRVIKTGQDLSKFIVDLVPLLHTTPEQAEPIQYVISELVRNTLEHSGPLPTAVVAAQVFPTSGVVAIGVADVGQGIRESLSRAYTTQSDLEAIQLAMRPGVTGTTRRIGGTAENAGAGLFFCKAMALTSRNYMVLHSGTGLFKLLKVRERDDTKRIYIDPAYDRATRHDGINKWPGTVVGIDLDVNSYADFQGFMRYVRDAYSVDVRAEKKARKKAKAKFR